MGKQHIGLLCIKFVERRGPAELQQLEGVGTAVQCVNSEHLCGKAGHAALH